MQEPVKKKRIELIDLGRGLALVAMAIYHFAWDLEFFGYAPPGMTAEGGWRVFARSIASSFLFLVGVSLFLAHARGVRWPPFLKRLGMVAGAAAAITAATWFATPDTFIFFGILHQIALASLLGLAFLHLPTLVTALAAVAIILLPAYLRFPFFDHPALWWIGLSTENPRSNDYVPLFPFFGAVLLGIAAARLASSTGLIERMRAVQPHNWTRPFQFAGRNSLVVYLIHQPILIGLVWLASLVAPPATTPPDIAFTRDCRAQCEQSHGAEFCSLYCVCVLDGLETEGRFGEIATGTPTPETSRRLQDIVRECSFETEFSIPPEGQP